MPEPSSPAQQERHTTEVHDGLQNVIANLGTERDKAAWTEYGDPTLSRGQIINAYRGSSLARKIVDKPAKDSVREWREWMGDASQISKLEAEEKRLGVARKVKEARQAARLWGGAALYISVGDTDPSKPLDPVKIRKAGVRHLTLIHMDSLAPGERQSDPELEGYGEPAYWTMDGGQRVHPSRLAMFHGNRSPDASGDMAPWGESVLTTVLREIRNTDATAANIASLVFEAKVDVINIPKLSQILAQPSGEAELIKRLMVGARAKGNNGTLILDGEETHGQKSTSFATLPDILDRFMQLTAAAAEMPMTHLFGTSPGGLNATGESDENAYHQTVKTCQTMDIEPALAVLDECLIRSALGERPEELHYNWRALGQPSMLQKAETGDKLMSALEKLHRIDSVSGEAIGNAAVNALTECGAFPGLESAVDEFPSVEANPEERGLIGAKE